MPFLFLWRKGTFFWYILFNMYVHSVATHFFQTEKKEHIQFKCALNFRTKYYGIQQMFLYVPKKSECALNCKVNNSKPQQQSNLLSILATIQIFEVTQKISVLCLVFRYFFFLLFCMKRCITQKVNHCCYSNYLTSYLYLWLFCLYMKLYQKNHFFHHQIKRWICYMLCVIKIYLNFECFWTVFACNRVKRR